MACPRPRCVTCARPSTSTTPIAPVRLRALSSRRPLPLPASRPTRARRRVRLQRRTPTATARSPSPSSASCISGSGKQRPRPAAVAQAQPRATLSARMPRARSSSAFASSAPPAERACRGRRGARPILETPRALRPPARASAPRRFVRLADLTTPVSQAQSRHLCAARCASRPCGMRPRRASAARSSACPHEVRLHGPSRAPRAFLAERRRARHAPHGCAEARFLTPAQPIIPSPHRSLRAFGAVQTRPCGA